MTEPYYGEPAVDLGRIPIRAVEFMHWLYLPVRIPLRDRDLRGGVRPTGEQLERNDVYALPPWLRFAAVLIAAATADAVKVAEHLRDPYVYVTAHRGFATPGNPLNRPGWHCDDFGGRDLNYIWCDEFPTRVLTSEEPLTIDDDDVQSMEDMATAAALAPQTLYGKPSGMSVDEVTTHHLYRLSPHVIHTTPEVPSPGGMRTFVKVSISDHRYNLLGNSHNHHLDYQWPMYDRAALRNQPGARANRDYVSEDS